MMNLSLIHIDGVTRVIYNDAEVVCSSVQQGVEFYQLMYEAIKNGGLICEKDED